jgi:hypothetical protein
MGIKPVVRYMLPCEDWSPPYANGLRKITSEQLRKA